jgi:glycine/D-amino acid oxidase-like deaminating enzyme
MMEIKAAGIAGCHGLMDRSCNTFVDRGPWMSPKSDPYWWDACMPGASAEADMPAELPAQVDVVVVGAGLTGASAARTLAKNGASVLLLDAETPGFGGSTRNGGMVGGGHRLSIDELTARYGTETAHGLLHEAHCDSLAFAKGLIAEEGIDCDFHTYGRFSGQRSPAVYEETARAMERLARIVPINVEMVPRTEQRREVGSDFYSGGLLLHDHGGLHPAKYHKGDQVRIGLPRHDAARAGRGQRSPHGHQRLHTPELPPADAPHHPGFELCRRDRGAA